MHVRDPTSVTPTELRFTWTSKLPWPADSRWYPRLVEIEKLKQHLNRHELVVSRLPGPRYVLLEGDKKIGDVARDQTSPDPVVQMITGEGIMPSTSAPGPAPAAFR